ncbi:MAG: TetR/AcrR family transcriptional regulator [Actinobacteria bacterium]|nr:MAG: TetR/AcrR family transcriptional regulator [Actinomycetota bacterium]
MARPTRTPETRTRKMSTARTRTTKPTRDEKKALTRRRLLDAAAEVFAHRGFAATSLDEVAEVAGFSKGAVYSNFAGKEDLFLSVLDEHVTRQMLDIRGEIDVTRTAGEQVMEAGQRFMDLFQRERAWYLLSFEFLVYAARNPEFQVEFAARQRAQREAVVAMLKENAAAMEIPMSLPPERMAVALEALANGIAFAKLADEQGVPDDLVGELFAVLVLPSEQPPP